MTDATLGRCDGRWGRQGYGLGDAGAVNYRGHRVPRIEDAVQPRMGGVLFEPLLSSRAA